MDATLMGLPRSEEVYELALEGLSRVNEWMYRHKHLPSIYAGGVRYQRERGEAWRHAADVVGEGWGDCEDLAAARVGELRSKGESGARVKVVRTGPRMTHAIVKRADGSIEDPSRRLGMGKPEQFLAETRDIHWDEEQDPDIEDQEEGDQDYEQIGADISQSAELSWTVNRTPTGWQGVVRVPLDLGRMLVVSRTAPTKEGATHKALAAASSVLDSPLAQSLIPPQAQVALRVLRSPQAQKAAKIAIDAAKKLKFW